MPDTGALTGLLVLDLSDARGVLAGRILALMGADVLAVEPPQGSDARRQPPFDEAGGSLYWAALGTGRRSLLLDAEGERDRLNRLIAAADVVIQSGSPARDGFLDTDALLALNPRVIHALITPYGLTGPKAHYADSDLTLWASGGPLKPTESQTGIPTRMTLPQAYHHAAADAVCGIMVALEARRQSGHGQQVATSAQASATQSTLSLSMAKVIGHPDYVFRAEVKSKKKQLDLSGSGSRTQRSKWACKDGLIEMHLALGPAAGRFTNNLFALMHARGACSDEFAAWDWVTLPPRIENDEIPEEKMEEARTQVADFIARLTKRDAIELALEHRLMLAPIMSVADLADNPHASARAFFQQVGGLSLPGPLAQGFDAGFVTPCPAPTPGEGGAEAEAEWLASRATPSPFLPEGSKTTPLPARPLSGLRVLDLSWVVAGPMIGRCLADFGAQIIRVESSKRPEVARLTGPFPGGVRDLDRSGLYENCNAGKRGITLDLATPEGREIVAQLASRADVLVESFAPGQMDRWGLGYDALSRGNPGLVMLSTSLMGQRGPWHGLAGFGNIGAAMSGIQMLAGREGADPVGPYGPYTDFVAPRLALPVLLAALEDRRKTGLGRHLDVSQAEAGMQFIATAFAEHAATGRIPVARGNRDPLAVPNNCYPCRAAPGETAWVALSIPDDTAWTALRDVTGLPALSDPGLRTRAGRHADEARIDEALAAWTREMTAQEAEDLLQDAGIAAHVVASPDDLARDPQLAALGHFASTPRADGTPAWHEACRFVLSGTPALTAFAAPHFGRDSDAILTELGLPPDRIAQLHANGILT